MEEAEIVALRQELEAERSRVEELTAERDSLKEENETIRQDMDQVRAEASETKKLNYTLARQLDTKPKKSFDEILIAMFGKGGK